MFTDDCMDSPISKMSRILMLRSMHGSGSAPSILWRSKGPSLLLNGSIRVQDSAATSDPAGLSPTADRKTSMSAEDPKREFLELALRRNEALVGTVTHLVHRPYILSNRRICLMKIVYRRIEWFHLLQRRWRLQSHRRSGRGVAWWPRREDDCECQIHRQRREGGER
jgi:hypothetical protein